MSPEEFVILNHSGFKEKTKEEDTNDKFYDRSS